MLVFLFSVSHFVCFFLFKMTFAGEMFAYFLGAKLPSPLGWVPRSSGRSQIQVECHRMVAVENGRWMFVILAIIELRILGGLIVCFSLCVTYETTYGLFLFVCSSFKQRFWGLFHTNHLALQTLVFFVDIVPIISRTSFSI